MLTREEKKRCISEQLINTVKKIMSANAISAKSTETTAYFVCV